MQMIFAVIVSITMFLCFFSLSASMSANIYESAKELGVLRAVGITTYALQRIYFYEALILVFAGTLLGSIVGTFISFTMVLQYSQFVGMPTAFFFPFSQLLWIFVISLICAGLSTVGPTRSLL